MFFYHFRGSEIIESGIYSRFHILQETNLIGFVWGFCVSWKCYSSLFTSQPEISIETRFCRENWCKSLIFIHSLKEKSTNAGLTSHSFQIRASNTEFNSLLTYSWFKIYHFKRLDLHLESNYQCQSTWTRATRKPVSHSNPTSSSDNIPNQNSSTESFLILTLLILYFSQFILFFRKSDQNVCEILVLMRFLHLIIVIHNFFATYE